ncbi:AAA family ATPase [Bacteroidota bacterium]
MATRKNEQKKFKFKSLNTYNPSRVMNNARRFRKLFEAREINYLNVALEFYNKLFDEADWETTITFKAFEMHGEKKGKEYCDVSKDHTISSDQNIVVLDFSWGEQEYGHYWRQGAYMWEVYIGKDLVGTSDFFIEDAGEVTVDNNPYFQVAYLKTYEAPKGGLEEDQRKYYKQFCKEETRYVMSEFCIINLLEEEWMCEVFFNYFDDTGVLVGTVDNLGMIKPNLGPGESYPIIGGWGCPEAGSWLNDNYRVEVVFMDTVVAIIPFVVGEKFVERISQYEALLNREVGEFYGKPVVTNKIITEDSSDSEGTSENDSGDATETQQAEAESEEKPIEVEIDNRPLSEILVDLDKLIGLEEIKRKVKDYIDYILFLQYKNKKGIKDDDKVNLHSVFTGNPGTGKTTVVKLLGKIFHAMGLLSKGHVHAVESSDLISQYVRQTGQNAKNEIEKARGGVLFIDEAYMLYKEDAPTDFGPEAIAALITEMSDGPGDIAIIMAGYPKEMETLIHSNPGLKSRIPNHYHFEDYTPEELVAIGLYAAKEKDVNLSEEALKKFAKFVTDAYRKRDRTFGNARLANSMIDEAKMNLGIRLVREHQLRGLTRAMLSTIEAQDIEDLAEKNPATSFELNVDQALLDEAMSELNALTGLESIKQEVHQLIRLTKYYREMDRDVLKAFSLHSVFMGNPGTGKTTVARIIGKIYKALGLLERGHLIDADSSDLIAEWVGKTAIKTKDLVKRAMGGILFIDEAYAITEGGANPGGHDFGKQAVAALIKEMEDHRGEFGVIAAGYPDNMNQFLESNPGVKSRFDRTFHFEDFSEEQLWEVAVTMFAQKGVTTNKQAEAQIRQYIHFMYETRNKFFGNARSIRKLVERAYRNHELRMADLPKSKRTKKVMSTVVLEDVTGFETQEVKPGRVRIGFTIGSQ